METDMELLYKGSNFSSKEISFMKSDSDAIYRSDFTPEQYLSDFFIENDELNNQWLIQFNSFVKDVCHKLDDRPFICTVIKLGYTKIDASHEIISKADEKIDRIIFIDNNQMETLLHALNAAIIDDEGIWQWLSESTLIIALWGEPVEAEGRIRNFINFIDTTLGIPFHAGSAVFPFMDFQPSMVPCNAVKALDHAAFLPPGTFTFFNDVTQNIYGDRLYQLGKIEDAAKEYEKGLKIKADNINLINSLGVCCSLMNRLDLAREQFERAITVHKASQLEKNTISGPNDETDDSQFMIFYNAALTCNLMGDIEKGVEYIKQVTAMHKDFFEAELTAGILFLNAKVKDEALVHLDRAVNLKPESAMVHRILGDLYLQTGLPVKAVHEYKRALKLNPCDAIAMSGLARAFEIQNKNLDIALTLALHSLAITPENPYFRTRLARIYLKKGNYDFADIEFSRARQQFEDEEEHLKSNMENGKTNLLPSDSADNRAIQNIRKDAKNLETLFIYADKKVILDKKSA